MKYKVSGSNNIPKGKAATADYKVFKTKSIKKFIKFINTHAVVPCELKPMSKKRFKKERKEGRSPATIQDFSNGYRRNEFVDEIFGWFRIDVDKKGYHKKVDKLLKKANLYYIKKPSTSNINEGKDWKWHYLIPAKNITDTIDKYKLQYFQFLKDVGIDIEWIDKSLMIPAQNMNPAGKKGVKQTKVVQGNIYVAKKVKAPEKPKLEVKDEKDKLDKKSKEYKKVKNKLKELDPDMEEPNWMNVAWALINTFKHDTAYKLFRKWSKKSNTKFNEYEFDKKWNSYYERSEGAITLGTLFNMKKDGTQKELLLPPEKMFKKKEKCDESVKKSSLKHKKTKNDLPKDFDPYNVGGELDDSKLEEYKNQRMLYDNIIGHKMHSFLFGASGAAKTLTVSWLMMDILKKEKDFTCHFWSFDAALNHNAAMREYSKKVGVADRFKIYESLTIEQFKEHYETIIEHDLKIDKLVIVLDTFKFFSRNVNDKNANKEALHFIKKLQYLGATFVSIGHTNKDGIAASGTQEIEGDSDAVLKLERAVNDETGEVTVRVSKAGRCRFNVVDSIFKSKPKSAGYKYLMSSMKSMHKVVEYDEDEFNKAIEKEHTNRKEAQNGGKMDETHNRLRYDLQNKDKEDVELIKMSIENMKTSKNKALQPFMKIIAEQVRKDGVSANKAKSLLKKYTGICWEREIKKHPVTGKKEFKYKLIKKKKKGL